MVGGADGKAQAFPAITRLNFAHSLMYFVTPAHASSDWWLRVFGILGKRRMAGYGSREEKRRWRQCTNDWRT
ncbi:hypothetical protein WI665_12030 [Vibrio cholerae]